MISDLQARRTALDPRRSFIVQAPAGSGKTGLLVYRLLSLLARVETPQQVLAITFTRKATAEMRARLMELLKLAESKHCSEDDYEQQGIELAAAVLKQDRILNWRLLDAPHQLQILTIDAFCSRLTTSMPWLSRLGDSPRTSDEAGEHYAAAIEQLFGELLESDSALAPFLSTVMLELDFNYNKARQLFSSMLAKRDQWLRHLLQGDLEQMRRELECAWQDVIDTQIEAIKLSLPQQEINELCSLAAYAAGNLKLNPQSDSPLSVFEHYAEADHLTISHWRALAHMLLTDSAFRKKVNIKHGFEAKNANTKRIHQLLKEYADNELLREQLIEVRSLPSANYSHDDWSQLLALDKVLKALAALLQLRFRAKGECDHSEVTQRANMALEELENPTDLGLRMDAQLCHILVDEFQDTSHGQVQLLKKLTAAWDKTDEHKTLFLVGDPMQSIYRFREADVSLFLQVTDNEQTQIFPTVDITALRLSENFRSNKSLVNWFNHTFKTSFPKENDVLSGAISYATATCSKGDSKNDSEAVCQYLISHNREQEAQILVTSVEQALAELDSDDDQIAILLRTRSQLDYLLPALKKANIAYTGIDIHPLADLQAVIDAVALCKAICREDDRVAWLALLRGPWCGLSLTEITQLAGSQDLTVWSQLQAKLDERIDESTQARLDRFTLIMQRAMAQRQRVSLASLTRWTWRALGGEHTLFGASSNDIETVFKLIADFEKGGDINSMRDLDRALSSLYAEPQVSDDTIPKVVVSTMHKSKGLQYHTVILPGLSVAPRHSDKEVLMWAETQSRAGNSQLLLAPLTHQNSESLHYQYLRHLDAKRSLNESVRLMYVATTRAEKRLILIAQAKLDPRTAQLRRPQKNTLLATVWNSLEDKFDFPLAEPEIVAEQPPLSQVLHRLPEGFSTPCSKDIQWQVSRQLGTTPKVPEPEESTQIEYEWATGLATGVGMVLHDWLQFNDTKVLKVSLDRNLEQRWRSELSSLRVPSESIEHGVRRLVKAVHNIQNHHDAHFLFRDYPESHNEFTLSAIEDGVVNRYRLDRTFVDEHGVRWIVDYKSTVHNEGDRAAFAHEQVQSRHKQQLEKYGFLFSQLDARPIQLAVYFPLLKQLISWRYQP